MPPASISKCVTAGSSGVRHLASRAAGAASPPPPPAARSTSRCVTQSCHGFHHRVAGCPGVGRLPPHIPAACRAERTRGCGCMARPLAPQLEPHERLRPSSHFPPPPHPPGSTKCLVAMMGRRYWRCSARSCATAALCTRCSVSGAPSPPPLGPAYPAAAGRGGGHVSPSARDLPHGLTPCLPCRRAAAPSPQLATSYPGRAHLWAPPAPPCRDSGTPPHCPIAGRPGRRVRRPAPAGAAPATPATPGSQTTSGSAPGAMVRWAWHGKAGGR